MTYKCCVLLSFLLGSCQQFQSLHEEIAPTPPHNQVQLPFCSDQMEFKKEKFHNRQSSSHSFYYITGFEIPKYHLICAQSKALDSVHTEPVFKLITRSNSKKVDALVVHETVCSETDRTKRFCITKGKEIEVRVITTEQPCPNIPNENRQVNQLTEIYRIDSWGRFKKASKTWTTHKV